MAPLARLLLFSLIAGAVIRLLHLFALPRLVPVDPAMHDARRGGAAVASFGLWAFGVVLTIAFFGWALALTFVHGPRPLGPLYVPSLAACLVGAFVAGRAVRLFFPSLYRSSEQLADTPELRWVGVISAAAGTVAAIFGAHWLAR